MMKTFLATIHWIVSIVNAILCIILMCIICPRVVNQENLGFDYMGVIVGVLSLLVAILLGWQIYSTLDIKKVVDEIKSHTSRTQEETMARAYISIMNQTSYLVEGRSENDDCFNAVANGLFACKHFHLAGNNQKCVEHLRMIANFKKEHCNFSKKQIRDLFVIIGQLKECGIEVDIVEQWIAHF